MIAVALSQTLRTLIRKKGFIQFKKELSKNVGMKRSKYAYGAPSIS